MILVIDNYDSFVHNLARLVRLEGAETEVVRNDQITVEAIRKMKPDGLILSPGPGRPASAGVSLDIVRQLGAEFPLLGVCLGHQAIAEGLGGRVAPAERVLHGRTSVVEHTGQGLFTGVPPKITVCRYHSLVVAPDSLAGTGLQPTAWAEEGTLMAIAHESLPIFGLQFHPEAILTEEGSLLLRNFVTLTRRPA